MTAETSILHLLIYATPTSIVHSSLYFLIAWFQLGHVMCYAVLEILCCRVEREPSKSSSELIHTYLLNYACVKLLCQEVCWYTISALYLKGSSISVQQSLFKYNKAARSHNKTPKTQTTYNAWRLLSSWVMNEIWEWKDSMETGNKEKCEKSIICPRPRIAVIYSPPLPESSSNEYSCLTSSHANLQTLDGFVDICRLSFLPLAALQLPIASLSPSPAGTLSGLRQGSGPCPFESRACYQRQQTGNLWPGVEREYM